MKDEKEKEKKKPPIGSTKKRVSQKNRKITLLGLESLSYNDFVEIKSDNFDPKSLVIDDEEDEEYKEILKKFDVKSPEPTNKKLGGAFTSRMVYKSVNLG